MSMDRLDDVTVGHACEVEGCSIVCAPNEARCYDHSVMRLIGTLFNETEMCRFNGVSCTHQATVCNENDVPMCESCHNIYRRIQRGRHYEGRSIGQMVGPHNELIRGLRYRQPYTPQQVEHWVQRNTFENFEEQYGAPREEELGEEDCTCNNLDHSQFNEECPLNEDPPHTTLGHLIQSGGIRAYTGIPPMRREEGEETE